MVSYFSNVANSRYPMGSLPLTTILFSERVRTKIEDLRSLPYGSEAFLAAKRSMPCYTPSGIFETRNSNGLIKHSGMLCIEWDKIERCDTLKVFLNSLPFIYYAGLSCSGRGVFALVKIASPDKHREYFRALADYFDCTIYKVDRSGSDVCRLRVASWDNEPVYNPDSEVWDIVPKTTPLPHSTRRATTIDKELLLTGTDYITRHCIDITQGRNNWLAIGSCIKSIMGLSGEDIFVSLSRYHPQFKEYEARKTYHSISDNSYGIGVFASACSRAGLPKLNDLLKRKI